VVPTSSDIVESVRQPCRTSSGSSVLKEPTVRHYFNIHKDKKQARVFIHSLGHFWNN
jgi:hypothetical protein